MDPKTDPCELIETEINHNLESSSREPVIYIVDSPMLIVSI